MRSGPRFRNSLWRKAENLGTLPVTQGRNRPRCAGAQTQNRDHQAAARQSQAGRRVDQQPRHGLLLVPARQVPHGDRWTTDPATQDAAPVDTLISKGFWISKYELTLGTMAGREA